MYSVSRIRSVMCASPFMLGALRKRIDKELLHATCTMQSQQRRTQPLLMICEMV
ncbi:uncharacterized protein LACBIDRAFT_301466 [Laccaria bicolor S238N-H82]|uniref:Predicted protein n=1 Tax=Laccaria bicolor (strain S238N-H82 / ATCC MYA-4686) TaxID=486041 RepID=B0CNM3_LACBS|nr:uncharacterized protein LACBIDRAFT_301466 [Laccaria bicolor S238N-H82]EDR15329.1 predicted protein [Laccaria bicolor S238N-H82]|eukprot:XP_001873537.1 predicted protein [Laccaria bicolor S238N-H82]